ncbi:hypothetical protein FL966_07785 [Caproiciproducens galactitolivorans]|uniref:DUF2007 domain-containing protein n=1 Tax=Caproiciproducens galactitolivorans TaxID=642589 RepID=A0A4Z0XXT6_9FIRM|nr:hypothetical protein [Caproiciproducens galactitolivorans]QEY34954.1 hypothetical protein FL966_07785 [Caproiciproducens galactitolivorans]TGJ76339.1 hypothetical protein CAGA_15450 [Caproiciproducens galactitolivorans]
MEPWSRSEVYVGYSNSTFQDICSLFEVNKIAYDYHVENQFSGMGRMQDRMAVTRENPDFENLYTIYVAKPDLKQAKRILEQANIQ